MDKVKMLWSKTNRWHRGLLIFIIIEIRVLPGGQRGFTCNDPALSYNFNGDTVNIKHLFGTVLLLPLAMMLIIERKYHRDVGDVSEMSVKPKKQALRWYKEYIFGFLLNLIMVQGLKLAVGAPRPHFFDTCDPNEATTCQGSEFVSVYTCLKPQQWSRESTKSFPSGHTSLAVHAGVFLAYYLYKRAPRSNVVSICQAALLVGTVYCGLSRMLDHRHHWWDVLGGAVIALPILAYIIYYLCRNFEAPSESKATKSDLNSVTEISDSNIAPLIGTYETVRDR